MTRKATKLTFVLDTDYTDDSKDVGKLKRYAVLQAIEKVTKMHKQKNFEVLASDEDDFEKIRKEKRIPELWTHDAGQNAFTEHTGYYVVEFDDDSTIVFAMIPSNYEEEEEEKESPATPEGADEQKDWGPSMFG